MLIVIERKKGEKHPTPFLWGSYVTGQTYDAMKAAATEFTNTYNDELRVKKPAEREQWLKSASHVSSNVLTSNGIFVIWVEWGENEFGTEMP